MNSKNQINQQIIAEKNKIEESIKGLCNSYGDYIISQIPKELIVLGGRAKRGVRITVFEGLHKARGGYWPNKTVHYISSAELERLHIELTKQKIKDRRTQPPCDELILKRKMRNERKLAVVETEKIVKQLGAKYKISQPTEYIIMLQSHLRDIDEAHQEWLQDAHDALAYSIKNKGIMHDWLNDRIDIQFYDALRRAISAFRRHNYTDYEELLQLGYDRDDALSMKQAV